MEEARTYNIGGGWGDRVQWVNWDSRRIVGWKQKRPRKGDILISPMESGKTAQFRFMEIEYLPDPPDMFFATVEDAGYLE